MASRYVDRKRPPTPYALPGGKGTAAEKIAALGAANIELAESPADMGAAVQRALSR